MEYNLEPKSGAALKAFMLMLEDKQKDPALVILKGVLQENSMGLFN